MILTHIWCLLPWLKNCTTSAYKYFIEYVLEKRNKTENALGIVLFEKVIPCFELSQMCFKILWLTLEHIFLCGFCVYSIATCLLSPMCVCMCIILSLFFSLEDVWMDLSCPRQPPVRKPRRVSPSSLGVFAFDLPQCLLKRVTWAVTLFSIAAHTHLQKSSHTLQGSWVTQRDMQTIQGCTFVCTAVTFTHEAVQEDTWTGVRVRVCADKQTHAHRNQRGHK